MVSPLALPLHHRDPFGRMLIAQAQIESLHLVSIDSRFSDYDVDVIWYLSVWDFLPARIG